MEIILLIIIYCLIVFVGDLIFPYDPMNVKHVLREIEIERDKPMIKMREEINKYKNRYEI